MEPSVSTISLGKPGCCRPLFVNFVPCGGISDFCFLLVHTAWFLNTFREWRGNLREGVGVAGVLRARDGSRSGGGQLGEPALPELEEGARTPWETHTKTAAGMASESRKIPPKRQRLPSAQSHFFKLPRFTILCILRFFRYR